MSLLLPAAMKHESSDHPELNKPSLSDVKSKRVDFSLDSLTRYGLLFSSPHPTNPESDVALMNNAFPEPKDLCQMIFSVSFLHETIKGISSRNAIKFLIIFSIQELQPAHPLFPDYDTHSEYHHHLQETQ